LRRFHALAARGFSGWRAIPPRANVSPVRRARSFSAILEPLKMPKLMNLARFQTENRAHFS
jgi:hypothetical protein